VRARPGAQRGCPDASGETLVSEADVENFDLTIGTTVAVAPAEEGPDVPLEVVGTYAVPDAGWWQGLRLVGTSMVAAGGTDPSAAHDAWLTSEATFDGAAVLPAEASQAAALVPATTGVDGLFALDDAVAAMTDDVREQGDDLRVLGTVADTADDVRDQSRLGARTVPLILAPLAVLSVFVLWLVLVAATQQRRGEVAVARLRGRGPAGAVRLLMAELLPVLLAGVVPGVAMALAGGVVARALLPGPATLEPGPGFVPAVLVAVLALVLTTLAAAVRVAREPLDALVRSGRTGSTRWRIGALDAVLLAAVGTGVLAFVTGSLTGSAALAGPALLALLVGLVLSHLVAPVATRAGRRLLRSGRLVPGLTLLDVGRHRETRVLVAVITVATALAVFSLDALVVGERTRDNAGEHDAGAPVVLGLGGHDLDGVRTALRAADPSGERATPVLLAKDTMAVEPDSFRQVAFFPRGGPSAGEWNAIAPPDHPAVELTGSRVSLAVGSGDDLVVQDVLDVPSELRIALVVTATTGVRTTIPLGPVPAAGERTTLSGKAPMCDSGCVLAAVQLSAAQGSITAGSLELGDLRVDGEPVDLGTSADDWNATEDERTVLRPVDGDTTDVLQLLVSVRGFYPVDLTRAWVPPVLDVIVPTGRSDEDLLVTGADGSDRAADVVGRTTLLPAMPGRSALVDLNAATRGRDITFDAHLEVWLDDDPVLVAAVEDALGAGGIAVSDVRRRSDVSRSYAHTVPTWSLALGAVVGPVVVLVAVLVLLVLAIIGWRARSRDLAILRLNGAGRRTTTRLAVWAHLPAVVLAVVAGVGAGVAGAALALPDVAFFPDPSSVPVVDTSIAWSTVLLVALVCALVLPAAVVVAGRAVARRAHLERAGEVG
jgi:putative ABC transport system permease protein